MADTPEQQARTRIDALLSAAGWVIQDMAAFNRNAAEGVAVREFHLESGPCDYLLFVGGKAAGVIEAKKTGVTLSGVAEQAARTNSRVHRQPGSAVPLQSKQRLWLKFDPILS